jgi:uncharacterized membrane protein YfcA
MLTSTILYVIAVVAFSAFIRSLAGFGFAIALVPIMSLVLPPIEAVAMGVLMQVVVGFYDIFKVTGTADKPSLTRLAIGSVAGTPIGIYALAILSPDAARILIAAAVLISLAVLLGYKPSNPRPNTRLAVGSGVLSGVFSGLAAMPGPPAVAYYLAVGMPPKQTRASLMLFFFFTSLIATPGLALAGAVNHDTLWLMVYSTPAMALGTWAGTAAFTRLDSAQYRTIAIGVMAIAGVLAGWRGISAYF